MDEPTTADSTARAGTDPAEPAGVSTTGESQGSRRSSASPTSQVSAAEEWNTSLRAMVGSFILLIVGLLLAVVLS